MIRITSRIYTHLIVLLLGFIPGILTAAGVTPSVCLTMRDLKEMELCELERLFAAAPPGPIPVGYARGKILCLTCTRLPRIKARMAGTAWRGKVFEEEGCFTNQWLGFQALDSQATFGPSWMDGKPCIVMEYPSGTPLFGNARDEVREIRPGLYLGRVYERCPRPKLRGYFALEVQCSKCR